MSVRSLVVSAGPREPNIGGGGTCRTKGITTSNTGEILTCDDQVLVLLVDTKIEGVAQVIPVDHDREVGIVYHGLSIAYNQHRHLEMFSC